MAFQFPGNVFQTGRRPSVSRTTSLTSKLVGLPITLLGAALALPGMLGKLSDGAGTPAPWWLHLIMVIMGLPPLVIGLYMMLGRRGVMVDRTADQLLLWHGLIVPLWRRSRKLGKSRKIVLGIATSSTGQGVSRQYTHSYGIWVSGRDGALIDSFSSAVAARGFAERCARTLGLPMRNRLTEPVDLRLPEELDFPLAHRLRKAGHHPEPAIGPASRIRVTRSAGQQILDLLPARFRLVWPGALVVLVPLAVSLWYAQQVVLDSEAPAWLRLAALLPPAFFALVLFSDLLVHTQARVAGDALLIRKRVGPIPWQRRFQLDEIEELYYDGRQVCVVSDRARFALGSGHTEADVLAVEALLRAWLVRYTRL